MELSSDKSILRKIEESDVDETGFFKVPDGVTLIERRAASNIKSLKVIDLNQTENINPLAFSDCINLEKVIGCPTEIKSHAFCGCNKLADIDLSKTRKILGGAFMLCNLHCIDISNVNQVCYGAFEKCCQLKKVIGKPATIGTSAFYGCRKLTHIDLSNATYIGKFAFFECGLESVNINNNLKISDYAFKECEGLREVIGSPKKVGKYAFFHCGALAAFDLSNTEKLEEGAFSGSGLTSIELSGIDIIPNTAFSDCSRLKQVAGSPIIIGSKAFNNCNHLESFNFARVRELDVGAFYGSGIRSADISNIKYIPEFAFYKCINLNKVIGSPQNIGKGAFCGCGMLDNLDFSNVESVDVSAFMESGMAPYIHEEGKNVIVSFEDYEGHFARASEYRPAYKISSIIDETKNAYIDMCGNPFIISPSEGKVYFMEQKDKFMALFQAS